MCHFGHNANSHKYNSSFGAVNLAAKKELTYSFQILSTSPSQHAVALTCILYLARALILVFNSVSLNLITDSNSATGNKLYPYKASLNFR